MTIPSCLNASATISPGSRETKSSSTAAECLPARFRKADVSVNIYAWLLAQKTGNPVELCCAIGDDTVGGIPYSEIVETARDFICQIGGFEKFAEWGLV